MEKKRDLVDEIHMAHIKDHSVYWNLRAQHGHRVINSYRISAGTGGYFDFTKRDREGQCSFLGSWTRTVQELVTHANLDEKQHI